MIIGGGVAGMAAAERLTELGIPCRIIEARDRLGGRAHTEPSVLGLPYDLGAAWLHSADANPLTRRVRRAGFTTEAEHTGETWIAFDGDWVTDAQEARIWSAYDRFETVVDGAFDLPDRSFAAAFSGTDRADAVIRAVNGPLEYGAEPDLLSLRDMATQIGTGVEEMVPDGLGAALKSALAPTVPVDLSTKVFRIRWDRSTPEVETDRGTYLGRAVLVTVSTGVLASGTIGFDPPLPEATRAAIDALPMGVLEKVALRWRALPETPAYTSLYSQSSRNSAIRATLLAPFGVPLTVGFLGGDEAVRATGTADARRSSVNEHADLLRRLLELEDDPVASHVTRWHADPYAMGAYSYARVGMSEAREVLFAPPGGRLAFAGEACSSLWATQVAGAYLTGREAAERLAEL